MSISFSPLFNRLHVENTLYHNQKSELNEQRRHRDLLERLHREVQSELRSSETFNWESHPQNRALLDEIYALDLLENIEERTYAFTDPEKLMSFIQTIQTNTQMKAQEVQENTQLSMRQKEELMQFYQTLLDILSKISQIVQNTIQRIH